MSGSKITSAIIGGVKKVVSTVKNTVKKAIHSTLGAVVNAVIKVDWKNVKLAVYLRYTSMVILVINMALQKSGHNPIPYSSSDVYGFVTDVLTALMFIVNTYKNNSTSKEAIQADKLLKELQTQKDDVADAETDDTANTTGSSDSDEG